MKPKHYVLLSVILFICLLATAIGIGISRKKQNVALKNDIEQTETDNNEGIMEDEIFEENHAENNNTHNKENTTVIPEDEENNIVENKQNGTEKESSDSEDKEGSNNDSEPPKNDSVELPRVPLN